MLGKSRTFFFSPASVLQAPCHDSLQVHPAGYDPATAPKVEKLEPIDRAAQDYYDTDWKDYWKRLHEKYATKAASKAQD